ncbi:hypothetical protein TMatcc_008994 [Talaromyces marneffei ATCC 18224]|uniref:Uncharacterized protein n=2 Tax=Talaromyces marneffei TaxID=37727 RepID=B6QKF5_TALMQ|nr:uncharacterized protein EYB26_008298 [Talaromyces marneffei]EEA21582.1 conserved hypothetical protein [Talaromyces marneffei ATCC 18224]KAE8550927.1 hypothetical protein EYB25_007159 [Talaromyces marneffei]QGA20592.1 hypothetical protein EYB26_008298 [Talaromyces marneffei]
MTHHQRRDRQIPKLQTILKMVFSSDQPSISAGQEVEVVDDCDEPPDQNRSHNLPNNDQIYIKSHPIPEKKESLLTRALKSPELGPVDRIRKASYPTSNASGHSTAELTSDGDLTSPTYSNTSSPPHISTLQLAPVLEPRISSPPSDPRESKIEADLGRKRCISFACTAQQPQRPKESEKKQKTPEDSDAADPPQRKSRLTFVCPSRQSETRPTTKRSPPYTSRATRSPPPTSRRPSAELKQVDAAPARVAEPAPVKKPGSIHMTGLGDFKPSEETRFHEFASSPDEVDGWMVQSTEHQGKITLADCMEKEMAIRKLGEEAEAEAIAEEEEENEMENEDDEDDTVNPDDEEDDTVHDFSSDDGNESDNEAGFADSDDESDGDSEYEFWAPSTTTAATSADNLDIVRLAADRRNSNISIDSLKHEYSRPPSSMAGSRKSRRPINIPRAQTPDLPDSTDFVCGTLDEDRPLEAAYISCIEERRRKKHIPVPQDIDPSFPTTDPEDNDDDIEENEDQDEDGDVAAAARIEEDLLRGRSKGTLKKTSRTSPRRVHSPAPRAHGHVSPKRMKSPAPKARHALAAGLPTIAIPVPRTGVNITGPVQRPHYTRTKSLPRTPNPFFKGLEESRLSGQHVSPGTSVDGPVSRSRELHTRGPIDIIQGLERKRQKRKEKFWRQHCRKAAAKEQSERRAARGKGAERMKELGLEVAERFKAYGVGQDTQLMLSV